MNRPYSGIVQQVVAQGPASPVQQSTAASHGRVDMGAFPLGQSPRRVQLARATYPSARPLTVYTQCPGVKDTAAVLGVDPTGYSWAQPRMILSYGDAGQLRRRDLPIGPPVCVVASFVQVEAFLAVYGWPSNALPTPPPSAKIQADVYALIAEGMLSPTGRGVQSVFRSFKNGATDMSGGIIAVATDPAPISLVSFWGIQNSGTDYYVSFFDRDSDGVGNSPANGDFPIFQIPAPSGRAFSLDLGDDGIAFCNGAVWAFSTTCGIHTAPAAMPEHSVTARYISNADALP